jgi:hypothetical protein
VAREGNGAAAGPPGGVVLTMKRVTAAAGLMVFCAVVPEARQTPVARLRAGAAKVDITPKQSDLTIATVRKTARPA